MRWRDVCKNVESSEREREVLSTEDRDDVRWCDGGQSSTRREDRINAFRGPGNEMGHGDGEQVTREHMRLRVVYQRERAPRHIAERTSGSGHRWLSCKAR